MLFVYIEKSWLVHRSEFIRDDKTGTSLLPKAVTNVLRVKY